MVAEWGMVGDRIGYTKIQSAWIHICIVFMCASRGKGDSEWAEEGKQGVLGGEGEGGRG